MPRKYAMSNKQALTLADLLFEWEAENAPAEATEWIYELSWCIALG